MNEKFIRYGVGALMIVGLSLFTGFLMGVAPMFMPIFLTVLAYWAYTYWSMNRKKK